MLEVTSTESYRAANARVITTLLCCCWAYSFAYSFFRCVLDRSGALACFAAVLPLAAVWASLERIRWGRLVLIGLSLLAFGLFCSILFALIFSQSAIVPVTDRNFAGYILWALRLFGESPEITLGVLLLSAATGLWFSMPWVKNEFELRKRRMLTPAQRTIALSVVTVWILTMMATPTPPESRSP